jgi:hypothetical protein
MITDVLMTPAYQEIIYKKYDILSHWRMNEFDHDFCEFEQRLLSVKKNFYAPNQRIIIEHLDTDYYFQDFDYGIGLYNLFRAFRTVDIPLFTMLLFTNNFGIKQEVNQLVTEQADQPTVIETFITNTHYDCDYQPVDLAVDQIQKAGLCMMGQPRVHRHAMFNFLKQENLLSTIATSMAGIS